MLHLIEDSFHQLFIQKLLEGQDITASNVCITEMSDRIIGPNEVIERWGMANTIHILEA